MNDYYLTHVCLKGNIFNLHSFKNFENIENCWFFMIFRVKMSLFRNILFMDFFHMLILKYHYRTYWTIFYMVRRMQIIFFQIFVIDSFIVRDVESAWGQFDSQCRLWDFTAPVKWRVKKRSRGVYFLNFPLLCECSCHSLIYI